MLHPFSGWLNLRCVAAMVKPPLGVLRGNGLEPRIDGRLQRLAGARLYGYRGWAVVEAEQDPAKATPKVYAQKAFAYVSKLLFS
jgi:hypothetical protein